MGFPGLAYGGQGMDILRRGDWIIPYLDLRKAMRCLKILSKGEDFIKGLLE